MNCAPPMRTILLLLLLLLAAPVRAEAPRATHGPLAERDLTILNASARPINEIYISPSTAPNWGTDLLGDSTIPPGGSARLALGRFSDCRFDVQVIYADATREDRTGLDICRTHALTVTGATATPLPGAAPRSHEVTLRNAGPLPIRQVFISPAYAESWEDDLLPRQLPPGESVALPYRGDCTADLRVVFANRAAEERRGLDLCATPRLTIAPGWTTAP